MALIKCQSCGRDISDKAIKCPGCGWVPGKLQNMIAELNSNNQDIENLKKLIVKLNNEKADLEKRLQEVSEKESKVVDHTDYEAIQKLQDENEQLRGDIQKLQDENELLRSDIQKLQQENELLCSDIHKMQKENVHLVSINEKQTNRKHSDAPIRVTIKRKDLIFGLAGSIVIFLCILCGFGLVSTAILKNELGNRNVVTVNMEEEPDKMQVQTDDSAAQADPSEDTLEKDDTVNKKEVEAVPFEPKEGGYKPGDVICEISGVSILYESCIIDDEVTGFVFKLANNGDKTYKIKAENVAINRVMMEDDYISTDNITAGNQGRLSFQYNNDYLAETCGAFQEMNLTLTVYGDYTKIDSAEGIYLYQ